MKVVVGCVEIEGTYTEIQNFLVAHNLEAELALQAHKSPEHIHYDYSIPYWVNTAPAGGFPSGSPAYINPPPADLRLTTTCERTN